MSRIPLHLDLAGRRVLVVGGGAVAARRVRALIGADVQVVAPGLVDGFPDVPVHRRPFEPSDVDGAWLVLACTGRVDDVVAAACDQRRVWCVRADDAAASPAWMPAVARVDDVVVSVTAGGDPRRAVALRDALSLALDSGALPLRRSRPGAGSVAFVGAGQGDPDLLTVRARRLLAGADVVVRDRQAPQVPLPEGVEVVDVGGSPDAQRDLAALLVSRAQDGRRVVRLRAGAGQAGGPDEVAGCVAAGVAVEVVPGVGVVPGAGVPGPAGGSS